MIINNHPTSKKARLRFTVSARIIGGYALVLTLSGGILLAGIFGINSIDNSLDKITGQAIPMIKSADHMIVTLLNAHTELLRFHDSRSKKNLDAHSKAYNRFKTSNAEYLEQLTELTRDNNQLKEDLAAVVKTKKKMFSAGDKIIGLHSQAIRSSNTVESSADEYSDTGDEILSQASDLEKIARNPDIKKKVGKLTELLDEISTTTLEALENKIPAAVRGAKSDLTSLFVEIEGLLNAIKQENGISESTQFTRLQSYFDEFKGLSNNLLDAFIKELNLHKQVRGYLKKADKSARISISDLDTLNEHISDTADEIQSVAGDSVSNSQTMIMGFALVAIVVSLLVGFLVTRSIRKPLGQSVRMIRELAKGDLTMTVDVDRNDELGDLVGNLNQMSGKLTSIVSEVHTGADTIGSAAEEIARGNMDLSQRTEEQASNLEETASSMEEMTSTVKQNADNAAQAQKLAMEANNEATSGGKIVGKAVTAMGEINTSSRKIADIINVVEEIAFQTNLLALNAAVEAARAGEQGRGFAVVASEVRNLAGRSSEAAKEIKALIEDSVNKVKIGSDLVDESGKTLGDIVGSIRKLTDIVSEIASASLEQASGIDQVNKSIMQIDEMTQQNAALVEQAAAASQSMLYQSGNLKKQISFFRIDNHTNARTTMPETDAVRNSFAKTGQSVRETGNPVDTGEKSIPALKNGTDADEWDEF